MHIALDARMMGAGKTRGIGRYIEETVAAALAVEVSLKYTLVVRALSDSPFVNHPRVRHVVADVPWYSWREQWRMPSILESIDADLIHVPHWNAPYLLRAPLVLTMHDLLLLQQPTSAKISTRGPLTRWLKYRAFRVLLHRNAQAAKRIFVPTQFVAADVQRLCHVPAGKIQVTGEGVSKFASFDDGRCPPGPFILYVGSAYPHKRLDLLFSVWERIVSKYPKHKLVIAGERDLFMQKLKAESRKLKAPITFLGAVTDAELAGLYRAADVFVFPSAHEGFGLPPLEALSLGCPVVVSDIPALREVLPRAGVTWFREGDEHGMISALERTLDHRADAKQAALAIKDTVCVQHDWHKSALEVVRGYKSVVESL